MDTYLIKLYEKQISLTEWFEAIGDPRASALRAEDATKHDRLTILNEVIGLPFGKPQRFSGNAVAKRLPELKKYVKEHGDELCAIRLIPKKPNVPKLRIRGYSVQKALQWFDEQKVNPTDYDVDFVPHDNAKWATIFTITDSGVYGEVKKGQPNQLTQGFFKDDPAVSFWYDFKDWHFDADVPGVPKHIQNILPKLLVTNKTAQASLHKKTRGCNYVGLE